MRGTHSRRLQRRHPQGIIPAHAGNTWWWNWCPASRWDHPRVCGEHTTHDLFVVAELGSSPRMRGTRNHRRGGNALRGTIPAYAGNTTLALLRDVWVLNHPRVCGEHMMSLRFIPCDPGSSPRMRGTPTGVVSQTQTLGIIPAYAGNTILMVREVERERDHPRVCGEHNGEGYQRSRRQGSSPRMRGTHDGSAVFVPRHGIIPAYAGNTCAIKGGTSYDWDHPRVCGEHKRLPRTHTTRPGSSPRMRGTLQRSLDMWYFIGIIPAYAGNTQSNTMRGASVWDHPRVCGEHGGKEFLQILIAGSSPRMRGTPHIIKRPCLRRGIIPAYAGNTKATTSSSPPREDHPRVCGEHSVTSPSMWTS